MGLSFKNHGYQVTREIKFCMAASNIVGSPVQTGTVPNFL